MKSALEWAANLLARARFPVFGGLLTDIRGAEAAGACREARRRRRSCCKHRPDARCYHVEPGFDKQIKRRVNVFYDRYYGADPSWFGVSDAMTHRPDRFAKIQA